MRSNLSIRQRKVWNAILSVDIKWLHKIYIFMISACSMQVSFLLVSNSISLSKRLIEKKPSILGSSMQYSMQKAGINITYKKTLGNGKKDKQDEVEFIRA